MFHSIPYNRKSDSSISKSALSALGEPASHGCIRLRVEDAQFIAENCLEGTKVKIYESEDVDEDLRERLLEASYTNEDCMSYNDFLGIPDEPGVLGRYSTGSDVEDLQYRLRALGFFTDEITGEYRTSTVNAVKQLQAALSLEQNGYATTDLLEIIYSQDAPTAMNVTLTEGMSGPAVRNLQTYLETLQLYSGDIDGIYDGEVITSVESFQQVYGYDEDGIATSEIQQAIYYEAGRVTAYFTDGNYTCEFTTEVMTMATVSANARVRIRSGPTTDSTALDSVSDGTAVFLLEEGSTWSKIQSGSTVGYIKNSFLEKYEQTLAHLRYTSATSDLELTIGNTLEEYEAGAELPKTVFEDYLANDGSLDDYEGIAEYATVNTQDDGILLNLRASPNSDSEVLATLENGTQVEVLLKSTVWSYVSYDELYGYLMNDYLDYWSAPEGTLDEDEDIEEEDDGFEGTLYALVLADADVYDLDSEDANVLGSLSEGIQVEVIESDDDWSLIEYQEHQGYMRNTDLQFILTEDYI